MPNMDNSLLEAVKFDEKGLICAIAQDRQTRRVLMVAVNSKFIQAEGKHDWEFCDKYIKEFIKTLIL